MKKLAVNKNLPFTLVGIGCSHTQGCAFAERETESTPYWKSKVKLRWASDSLSKKYKVPCTSKYITDNLTWMSKLKQYIPISKVINFGYGGEGTDSSIRVVNNYILDKTPGSLKDHLFIFQLQTVLRNEIFFKLYNGFDLVQGQKWHLESLSSFFAYQKELGKDYYKNFYDELVFTVKYYTELLYLQSYLEKLGAQVRFFGGDPFHTMLPFTEKKIKALDLLYGTYIGTGYEKKLQGPVEVKEIFKKLNLIHLPNFGDKEDKYPVPCRLHDEGLVLNDKHLSENGNQALAESLFENINNKYKFKIDEKTLT